MGEWLAEAHGGRGKRAAWRELLHPAVGPDGGEVLACEPTINKGSDAFQVDPLLEPIPGSLGPVIADGPYDGEPVYRTVGERQPDPLAAAVVPPHATAAPSAATGIALGQRDEHLQLIRG